MQIDAQLAHRAEQDALHVVSAGLQAFGDLVHAPAFDVLEQESLPLAGRQALHGDCQILLQRLLGVFAIGRRRGLGEYSVGIEFIFGAGLAPPDQVDGGIERNAMNPGIEGGVTAKVVATVPGLQQGFLYRIRGQVLVTRDA